MMGADMKFEFSGCHAAICSKASGQCFGRKHYCPTEGAAVVVVPSGMAATARATAILK